MFTTAATFSAIITWETCNGITPWPLESHTFTNPCDICREKSEDSFVSSLSLKHFSDETSALNSHVLSPLRKAHSNINEQMISNMYVIASYNTFTFTYRLVCLTELHSSDTELPYTWIIEKKKKERMQITFKIKTQKGDNSMFNKETGNQRQESKNLLPLSQTVQFVKCRDVLFETLNICCWFFFCCVFNQLFQIHSSGQVSFTKQGWVQQIVAWDKKQEQIMTPCVKMAHNNTTYTMSFTTIEHCVHSTLNSHLTNKLQIYTNYSIK